MGELTPELRAFLDAQRVGVLATVAEDGRPRQSLVYYARDGEHLVLSTLAQRLKAKDVERSGWASLCVMGHEPPYPSAVFSGRARDPDRGHRRRDGRDHAADHRRPSRPSRRPTRRSPRSAASS